MTKEPSRARLASGRRFRWSTQWTSTVVPLAAASIALSACGGASDADASNGGAPSTSTGASAGTVSAGGATGGPSNGGGVGASSGNVGASAGASYSNGGVMVGGGLGGSGAMVSSTGGTGTSGAGTSGNGGLGTAGSGSGGTGGTGVGGSGAAGAAGATGVSGEDDGASCTVASLPDSGSLPTNMKLPDPFKKLDGTRISSKADWRCRRAEIRKQAEKYTYGTKPPKPESVTGTVSSTSISVKVMDKGKSTTFTAQVAAPTSGSAPYPSVVIYGGASFGAPLDSGVLNSEGIAVIKYDPYAVGKEGTPRSNKQGAFYDIAGSNSTTGLLVAWAWGVSRLIDVIEQSDGKTLKADAVAVSGCSRFGKGAFIAGVFDQRIPLTMPIESGSAGVPIWRGIPGEGAQSLNSAYGEQPWFGDAFSAFTGSPDKAPLDTHEVVAMIAPRGLFIMDNPFIANLGPKSAHVAALGGAEVYKALGAGDNITYFSAVQNGSHCSMRPEWADPLRSNIRKFLKKTGNDPGVFKVSSSATGKLSDWIDWTTPTLN